MIVFLHVAPRFYFCEFCEAKKSNACDAVSFIWLHRSTGCLLIYFTEEISPESGFLCFASRDRDAATTQLLRLRRHDSVSGEFRLLKVFMVGAFFPGPGRETKARSRSTSLSFLIHILVVIQYLA